ncbi:HAD-IIB family hydrolase [Sulfurivermis fontis]|uniref:HAD-IIB family hydrolase n=1 Tax=Sulfurivermis fontis TaxID=1972068 RepID=UPI001E39887A|nr:HAD-IIB family hydrolase [Sulfurivermis fontis]
MYIILISVHGLIRGHNLELGRDADTGGQTKYVVELARALAEHPDVSRVDLLTRQIIDPKVASDYSVSLEALTPKAYIVRLPFGPRRYLRKEVLWPYLDSMADQALQHIRSIGRVPDIIHSHYADAGYVGARLASLLGVPLVHTGHSLGREKRRRLLDQGVSSHTIETQYNMTRRIEAEEAAMDVASLVIASTRQEVEKQYSQYANYQPRNMQVIPPGTDLSRFHPPRGSIADTPLRHKLNRFLRDTAKPMVLAISRADERKNIHTLLRAYGENSELRQRANLVIIAGNRDDITQLDRGPRTVLTNLLLLIDKYDLYGHVAYPKDHHSNDIPELYRLAARSHGIFVNPALTEPFGLTLIEAAASGLPIIATEDGGPHDIVDHCKNGLLIDPLDADALGEVILSALNDRQRWRTWASNGIKGAHRHYSWQSHVTSYLKAVRRLLGQSSRARMIRPAKSRLPTIERMVVCDIDNTLLGDDAALAELVSKINSDTALGFGVATGRHLSSALNILAENSVPVPDVLITSVGTEIHYGKQLRSDTDWQRHIDYRWERDRLEDLLDGVPGLRLQPKENQRRHKLSYYIDPDKSPPIREIVRHLRQHNLTANLVYSHQAYLDLLPIRASKGQAVRYLAAKWGLPPRCILVAGDSGNDIEMLRGDTLGVVVGNYSPELRHLHGEPQIYFAHGHYARGILEGLEHYAFLVEQTK